jgi:lipoprotein-anchoring transpeptidase ErfK/SrfK
MVSGCVSATVEPASEANFTPRDKKLLANPPYAQATIPEPYLRHIVSYHRREAPGTIVVDPDARYLYYVLPKGQAIRYGVTVGEEALVFSGVAKVGRMEEWPAWVPTADIKKPLHRQPGHALSHPWHKPAGIYRLGDLVGLHPHDQRGRHRPLQEGQARHSGCGTQAKRR